MQDENTDLELLIDRALAAYSDHDVAGGPRSLAAGALQRIEEHRARRRRWRMVFALGAPALAILIMTVFLLPHPSPPRARQVTAATQPYVVHQSAPAAPAQVAPAKPHIVRVHRRTVVKQRRLPKLEQFPTPRPPSEQELLLMKFVETAPEKVLRSVAEAQQKPIQPIQVASLQVSPLNP